MPVQLISAPFEGLKQSRSQGKTDLEFSGKRADNWHLPLEGGRRLSEKSGRTAASLVPPSYFSSQGRTAVFFLIRMPRLLATLLFTPSALDCEYLKGYAAALALCSFVRSGVYLFQVVGMFISLAAKPIAVT